MSTRAKIITTVIAFAILGLMLSPQTPIGSAVFGAPPEDGPQPTGPQIGLLMVVGLIEAIAFGLGAAFLFFARDLTRSLVRHRGYATAVWLGTAWLLLSWVPHSAMHQVAGHDYAKLIVIEYLFHVTLVGAAVLYAATLIKGARIRRAEAQAQGRAATAP